MNEYENIEIRSEEVQEILGTPPGWMARYGTLFAFVAIVVVGWVGFLLKYPDTVEASITITTTDPPKRLVTETRGRVKKVLAKNEQEVEAGQVLIVFDNNASLEDVMTLENAIMAVGNTPSDSTLLAFSLPGNVVLGELKDELYSFYRRQQDLNQFLSNPYDNLNLQQLNKELGKVQSMIRSDRERWATIGRQIESVEKRLRREEQLSRENLLAEERVSRTREELLSLRRSREGIEASIKSKELDMDGIRSEMSGVRQVTKEGREEAAIAMRESFQALQKAVEEWKRKFVISSPIKGIVSFNLESISEQQYVEADREIGVVVPLMRQKTKGFVQVDMSRSGKIHSGQKVIVKLDSYSYAEYGAIEAKVDKKSQVPIEGKIIIEIGFRDELVTTLGKRIEPSREMKGDAIIITNDKRFIERVFERVRSKVTPEG
ncbi:MAG: HlyD family efflux transporter periplasmic adaptor subunit [Lewinellaceae bacterium]|nr:HlyD family efflux transporter periplasmic adaptor subunit [Lewinellaceae bacterium]MCB9288406.1 HlyD family efflux transporter periplasmic adaptor subunit [Lewinellaceae bacterium]